MDRESRWKAKVVLILGMLFLTWFAFCFLGHKDKPKVSILTGKGVIHIDRLDPGESVKVEVPIVFFSEPNEKRPRNQ